MNAARHLRTCPGSCLLAVLTGFFLATVFFGSGHRARLIIGIISITVVLLASRLFMEKGRHYRALEPLGLAALALRLADWVIPAPGLDVAVGIVTALFLGEFLLAVLRLVLGPGVVTHDRIMAAVAGYLLLGACWAFLHSALAAAMPGAYRVVVDTQEGSGGLLTRAANFPSLYYSFGTLMTLSAATVVPVTHLAQAMTWMEAAMGEIYLTVLVARLVSLHVGAIAP